VKRTASPFGVCWAGKTKRSREGKVGGGKVKSKRLQKKGSGRPGGGVWVKNALWREK